MNQATTNRSHRTVERNTADNYAPHQKPCRFWASKSGCRAGEGCPFLHVTEELSGTPGSNAANKSIQSVSPSGSNQTRTSGQAVQSVPQSRVVPKPIPQGDPRDFQIGQIRRRFSPKESHDPSGGTILRFKLTPSDPDFPFELSSLDCALGVPTNYPQVAPSLKVKNTEIQVGFALNIERGFDDLVANSKDATLLSLVNALDRNLEKFLSMEQAKVVKLIPNADRRHLTNAPAEVITAPQVRSDEAVEAIPASYVRTYTADEKNEAKSKRSLQVKQLESRLGRQKSFRKSSDGIAFTLPMEPRLKDRLPPALKAVSTVTLYVPLLYPLEPCRAKFEGLPAEDCKPAEVRFEERAREFRDLTLMAHLNYLAQNLHTMAQPLPKEEKPEKVEIPQSIPPATVSEAPIPGDDRDHVVHIPRPPEWDLPDDSGFSEDSDDDSISSEESKDLEAGGVELEPEAESSANATSQVERGTAISFPNIELFGIELFEISILNITVKCERCRDQMEVTGLKDGVPKSVVCKKCSTSLSITFRKALVHAHSVRAGFLDLEGCTVVDMLPSTFIPTCAQCSTPWSLGIVSVRGETTTNVCREPHCHQKFVFKIPETKFLRITNAHLPTTSGPRRKRETLGLISGQELPKRGTCQHYRKSYRWFRFSCCQKIFPCDRCHDEVTEHANEHANRMICGFCSREGNYRPEDCAFCHGVLVGRKGHGFWEGGKGTRDRVRMSRKDPRKFKRVGGAAKV